jgi:hypothetical protein
LEELDELKKELNKTTYKGDIKSFDDDDTKAKNRVSKAIKRAIDGLSGHPKTHEHFSKSFKPYSLNKSYRPADPILWVFE